LAASAQAYCKIGINTLLTDDGGKYTFAAGLLFVAVVKKHAEQQFSV
jgi:hypothetical protein